MSAPAQAATVGRTRTRTHLRTEAEQRHDAQVVMENRVRDDYLRVLGRPPQQQRQVELLVSGRQMLDAQVRNALPHSRSTRLCPCGAVEIKRSWPQVILTLAPHMGWCVEGLTARQLKDKFQRRAERLFKYLSWVEYLEVPPGGLGPDKPWRPCYGEDSAGDGILLRVPAGVAQSVRAAES